MVFDYPCHVSFVFTSLSFKLENIIFHVASNKSLEKLQATKQGTEECAHQSPMEVQINKQFRLYPILDNRLPLSIVYSQSST